MEAASVSNVNANLSCEARTAYPRAIGETHACSGIASFLVGGLDWWFRDLNPRFFVEGKWDTTSKLQTTKRSAPVGRILREPGCTNYCFFELSLLGRWPYSCEIPSRAMVKKDRILSISSAARVRAMTLPLLGLRF